MADTKGQISRDEFADLEARNQELELMVEEMARNLSAMNVALLQGVGVDPAVAARGRLPRRPVQFTRHYNRMAQPSTVKDGPNLIDAYCVAEREVVKLRLDEVERLQKTFPGLIEVDEKKFADKPGYRREPDKDEYGRFRWRLTPEPIQVKVLMAHARDAG